jgi:hypothetical protein
MRLSTLFGFYTEDRNSRAAVPFKDPVPQHWYSSYTCQLSSTVHCQKRVNVNVSQSPYSIWT